jgi:hypothetical protein
MSFWERYVERRKMREGLGDGDSPVDRFRFNTDDDDVGEDHEKVQQELFKVVMGKYPQEAVDFLNTIAQRGDEEVASLLRRMKKEKGPRLPRGPQHPTDGDEVVPATADTGHNPDFNSGE